jgi:ferredoxin
MTTIKIKADRSKCQGHARCYALAPDIFELDEEGYIGFTERVISSDREKRARQAVRACPENALSLTEE